MTISLVLIPTIPFLGFLILALFGPGMTKKAACIIGAGSIGIAAIVTLFTGVVFLKNIHEVKSISVVLWEWISAGSLKADISFSLDALSLVFCFVITFVGFLIHLYSIEFMKNDEGFSRFFLSLIH